MAVLIEAINVVIQLETLSKRYPGGLASFEEDIPNSSFCADDHLARVGFLQQPEMEAFAERLDELGFCAIIDGKCADFAIVDQVHGPIAPCDWFEWGRHADGFNLGWLAGTKPGTIVVPQGWTLEDSLSIDSIEPRDTSRDRDATTASNADIEELVGRTLEVEEAILHNRAAQDTQAGEAIHAELTKNLLPRAERMLDTAEDKAAAHYAHGVVLRVCGMFDEAIAACERALELVPESVPGLMEMTVCLGEANRSSDAYPFAKRAVELDARSAATWGNLALVCIQMGERTEARVALDQALSLDPTDEKNKEINEHFEEFFP